MTDLIRAPRPSDQAYIASTWARNASGVGFRAFTPGAKQLGTNIDRVLDAPTTRAVVRHAERDANRILGYCVYADAPGVVVVHYVYVRREARERGLAAELLKALGVSRDTPVVCTSLGPDSRLLRGAYKAAAYMPLEEFLR